MSVSVSVFKVCSLDGVKAFSGHLDQGFDTAGWFGLSW